MRGQAAKRKQWKQMYHRASVPNRARGYPDRHGERCTTPRLHAPIFLDAVKSAAISALRRPEQSAAVVRGAIRAQKRRLDSERRRIGPSISECDVLREKKRRVARTYTDGSIDESEYETETAHLDK